MKLAGSTTLSPTLAAASMLSYGPKVEGIDCWGFLAQTTIRERESRPSATSQFNHHNAAALEQREVKKPSKHPQDIEWHQFQQAE